MGKPRSLLRSVEVGTSGRRHNCKSNSEHVLLKGDPMLMVKIDRDTFHYCVKCAVLFIANARVRLTVLEEELRPSIVTPIDASRGSSEQ